MRFVLVSLLVLLVAFPASARVVLVGIDGGEWSVIDDLIEAGELPNLASLIEAGVHADLETVEPVTSPVVWTSIATGRRPEAHGVTDFFSTALEIEVPTVFERLAERGVRGGLYDYLMTWPPTTLPNGFVIPGWLRRDPAVTPADVWSRIPLSPFTIAYTPLKTTEDYLRNAADEVKLKAARWNALAEAYDVEVGAVSFYGVDGMSHRFWHGAYPESFDPEVGARATPAERTVLFDIWRGIDRSLGEVRAALSPDDTILVVSDHGFHAREEGERDVWVGHFVDAVRRAGLDPERDGFAIIGEFGQLMLRVSPREFEKAEATLMRLAELVESHRTEDGTGLYWAAEVLDVAPRPPGHERSLLTRLRQWVVETVLSVMFDVEIDDGSHALILAIPRAGVLEELWPDGPVHSGDQKLRIDDVFSRQVFTGSHDEIAIFVAAGGGIVPDPQRGRISVLDVAPLIFHLAGSPVPDDLEGQVPAAWVEQPVRMISAHEMPGIARDVGSSEPDDPELVEKLRRLGYIE
jgi:hypothetical protein